MILDAGAQCGEESIHTTRTHSGKHDVAQRCIETAHCHQARACAAAAVGASDRRGSPGIPESVDSGHHRRAGPAATHRGRDDSRRGRRHSCARLCAGWTGAMSGHAVFSWRRVRQGRNRRERRVLPQPSAGYATTWCCRSITVWPPSILSLPRSMMRWRQRYGLEPTPTTWAARRVPSSCAAKVREGIWLRLPVCVCARDPARRDPPSGAAAAGDRLHVVVSHPSPCPPPNAWCRARTWPGITGPIAADRCDPRDPRVSPIFAERPRRSAVGADHRRRIRHAARRSAKPMRNV